MIAGLLGLLVAWLIPKGGRLPLESTAPTPTPARGVTAVEERLSDVSPGVSFRVIDGVRVFLVRSGDKVVGFQGLATDENARSLYWCIPDQFFFGEGNRPVYDRTGVALDDFASRNLDRITVIVAAGRVTIVPHEVVRGDPKRESPHNGPVILSCRGDRLG